ncbi:hypothetical protein F4558_002871 [Micromonospora profundi]|nr:hypothetical protein [Micromonospora profundi]
MRRPTRHPTHGEVPDDLRQPAPPDLLRSTFAANTPKYTRPTTRPSFGWLRAPVWSRTCPRLLPAAQR